MYTCILKWIPIIVSLSRATLSSLNCCRNISLDIRRRNVLANCGVASTESTWNPQRWAFALGEGAEGPEQAHPREHKTLGDLTAPPQCIRFLGNKDRVFTTILERIDHGNKLHVCPWKQSGSKVCYQRGCVLCDDFFLYFPSSHSLQPLPSEQSFSTHSGCSGR